MVFNIAVKHIMCKHAYIPVCMIHNAVCTFDDLYQSITSVLVKGRHMYMWYYAANGLLLCVHNCSAVYLPLKSDKGGTQLLLILVMDVEHTELKIIVVIILIMLSSLPSLYSGQGDQASSLTGWGSTPGARSPRLSSLWWSRERPTCACWRTCLPYLVQGHLSWHSLWCSRYRKNS